MSSYNVVRLDELEPVPYLGSNLLPIRHTLGVLALGLNAWTADTGGQLIPPHKEEAGSEEIYVVYSGRARFTVGEEEAEAPTGTIVFVPPLVHRTAVAEEDGTVVVAAGGDIGKAFPSGAWDTFAVADAHRRAGRMEESRAVMRKAIEERPDRWALVYNFACLEALDGNLDEAFELLARAKEMNPDEVRRYLTEDSDLDPLRSDPRFEELTA